MKCSILLLCAALALVSSCATLPREPWRSTGPDSVNYHADSLAWAAEVKSIKRQQQTILVIVIILIAAALGSYRFIGISGIN